MTRQRRHARAEKSRIAPVRTNLGQVGSGELACVRWRGQQRHAMPAPGQAIRLVVRRLWQAG